MKGVLIRSLVGGKKEIEPKVSFGKEDISETREVGNLSQAWLHINLCLQLRTGETAEGRGKL